MSLGSLIRAQQERERSRSPQRSHCVIFGVRVNFAIREKPTALHLSFRDDRGEVVWPPEWDKLFEGPEPPRVPGPEMVFKLFKDSGIFADFLSTQPHGRFPRDSNHEFRIRKIDPDGAHWEIECVYLGLGLWGLGKGGGANERECWSYGESALPE